MVRVIDPAFIDIEVSARSLVILYDDICNIHRLIVGGCNGHY